MKKLLLCASAFALMLGSCSKDDTEVAPIEVKGKAAFSASMTIGDGVSTRTHVGDVVDGEDRYYRYYWDKGDAIGASALTNASAVIPFVVDESQLPEGEDVASVNFFPLSEDLAYFGEQPIYLAYPYDKSVHVDGSDKAPTMAMTIPATQLYRTNSFATMTAPAVGVIMPEDIKDGQIPDITMEPVASYVRFGVVGSGKLTKISLSVKNPDGNYYVLNGSAAVSLKDGGYALNLNTTTPSSASAEAANINTIDFGNGGFGLDYVEPTYLWFVVPADITFSKSTLTFTATVDGSQSVVEKTYKGDDVITRNMVLDIPVNIELGMEDKVLIENPSDFITYVHQVSLGESADPDYKDGDEFKTAILVNNLAFNSFNAGDAYAENQAKGEDADELLAAALNWYIANGSSFTSIAAGAKIEGVGDGGKTLSYMKVKGGLFADSKVTLKNVTFRSTTVDVAGMETPSFLKALPKCEAVSISAPVIANLPEGANGVYLNSVNANALPENKEMKLGFSPTVPYFANVLTVNASVDVNGDANYKTLFGSTLRFVSIKGRTAGKIISNVSPAAVEGLLKAIDVTGKSFSVLSGKGKSAVSYWTGIPATGITADDYLTAEELAWAMQQTSSPVITLTNNIDLGKDYGKVWKPAGQVITINGGGYTVSNAKVYNESTLNGTFATYSLFGNVATVSNLNVKNVEIAVDKLPEGATSAIVGGLAAQGSANDVTIDYLSISVGKDIAFLEGYNTVGGLISKPNDVSVNNSVSHLSININGNENVEYVGGMFGVAYDGVYKKDKEDLASFSENVVASWYEGATAYPLVGVWTVTNNATVDLCKNAGAALVGDLVAKAGASGQSLYITFVEDHCTTPYYANLVNGGTTATTVYINDVHNELQEPTK